MAPTPRKAGYVNIKQLEPSNEVLPELKCARELSLGVIRGPSRPCRAANRTQGLVHPRQGLPSYKLFLASLIFVLLMILWMHTDVNLFQFYLSMCTFVFIQ